MHAPLSFVSQYTKKFKSSFGTIVAAASLVYDSKTKGLSAI